MTVRDDEHDPAFEALATLTMHEPDGGRAARTVARGRSLLTARVARQPLAARFEPRGGWRAVLEPLLVAGASAVFLLEVLSRATQLYR
jgi:hypothetical protein